jgi:ATP-dependent Clp protease ATP-binding subunit ClpC
MQLFVAGKLNALAFDQSVRRGTHELNDVLEAARETRSGLVETTHFLMAIANVIGGETRKGLTRRGLTVEQWRSGLAGCARAVDATPIVQLAQNAMDEGVLRMLQEAAQQTVKSTQAGISEPILLSFALKHLPAAVRELCESADINVEQWRDELEGVISPPPPVAVFADQKPHAVISDAFAGSGKKVLRLLKTETEALGYPTADPRHLLMALLEIEGGLLQYGIHQQGFVPRKIQEALMMNLRGKARQTRTQVCLDGEHLQPILQQILSLAGQLAARDVSRRIGESHLLRAFLSHDSTARAILSDQKINIAGLRELAESHDATTESEMEEDVMADIETIRKRLLDRLVGQDIAINQILPYIEFMRFGMITPGHPVGVFLFCGQSGSGKTELAKELARAVYGSEEFLIFLEMGQFNSPESMNIFVGAPPGYIGYGEGKLTNGLRDKPRAVVLFDEVEKAHSKVLDALLRFLDEGRIDDPAGPVRDGTQCIVILTSNVASDELEGIWSKVKDKPNRRAEIRQQLRDEFKKHKFRVEFLNRVDEVILFNTLSKDDYIEIARRHLKLLLDILRQGFQIDVTFDDSIAVAIGTYCFQLNEGARSVLRLTRTLVVLRVARYVTDNRCTPPLKLKAYVDPARQMTSGEPEIIVDLC